MKKVLLLAVLGITFNANAQKSKEDNNIYTTVETPPTFPNGYKALCSFFCDNINPPKDIPTDKRLNKVFLRFVIEKDGSVTNPEIIRGIDTACDQEAIRVIKLLPKWEPGGITKYQKWIPLRVYFTVPLAFYQNKSDCEKSYNQAFIKK
jgi:periplasmic protein TonB